MSEKPEIAAIAIFHKRPNGRFELFSVYTTGPDFRYRNGYDVDWCRRDGLYYYHSSSGGPLMPNNPMPVDGIYWSAKPELVKEQSSTICNRASRKRNKTRRLAGIPRAFTKYRWKSSHKYRDIFDWLQDNGREDTAIFCAECEDHLPVENPCEHIWWCEVNGWWSIPTERFDKCKCEDCGAAQ